MHKLSQLVGGEQVAHSHAPLYSRETLHDDSARLIAGVPGGDVSIFTALLALLQPPYILLYVLHTPRGEGQPGRYQSPELESAELEQFLKRFSSFLGGDARHDLWGRSQADEATVVWDRHNLIYAYGPLDRFAAALRGLGFREGVPEIPDPHAHHYRAEFDRVAADLLATFHWTHSPLRSEDEQSRNR
jgi:hypothetical protein